MGLVLYTGFDVIYFEINLIFLIEYASDFEYASVLNIPVFWIYQGCEYAGVLNMLLVLNMSGFSGYTTVLNLFGLTLGSEYTWICLNNFWMPDYAWMCLNLSEWLLFYIYPL